MRIAVCLPLLALAACQSSSDSPENVPSTDQARLYDGFGGYTRFIGTDSEEARRWFDQGIQLLYGYNHDEAIRSFQRTGELDPGCIMAFWGVAYANGLHINNPLMSEEASWAAYDASRKALSLVDGAAPVEAALAQAVAERYAWPVPEDRSGLDQAYADAMEGVFEAFPEDPDVGALFAEALMTLQPWDLWTHEGEPKGRALEIVDVLEHVLELRPDHPGANHFYIHTVEASPSPERAVPAADRLVDMVPGAGHLVHMPSHIYTRVGRYADAADANVRAIAADKAYFALAPEPRFYSLYFIHNVHFLAYAAMMEGRHEASMSAARDLEKDVPQAFLEEYVQLADGLMTTPLHVMIRFGKWEEILAEPAAPKFRLLSRALRHYARGVAYAATDRVSEARAEQVIFLDLAENLPDGWSVGNNSADQVLQLATHMLEGEILYRDGQLDAAFAELRKGVALEDTLVYDEPPGWMQPVRHALGALLLAADRPAEAETVYREDLVKNPGNGWSLLGLEQSLLAQGTQATDTEVRELVASREAAWARADVQPGSSCFCEPGE